MSQQLLWGREAREHRFFFGPRLQAEAHGPGGERRPFGFEPLNQVLLFCGPGVAVRCGL
ncbi:MAG TPA: hypothetical protein VFM96_02270 [Gaiellaceae bacterium]|nr:hypothetical protein [Gaiellaceae bacterium]